MQEDLVEKNISFEQFKNEVLNDYRIALESREASLLGRREVLTGKAKFGIFGDGKEIPQLAMAKVFKKGDFRSGYYRDQTFMMALGELSVQQHFAALYAHPDIEHDPASGGRQMGGHFATRSLDSDGEWKDLTEQYNSSADISPTSGQMPRLLGLAQASKVYRNNPSIDANGFSRNGDEIAFGTIGNASTSEGLFWETINAAGVTEVPMILSIWDDEYGISVPAKYQTTKEDLSSLLSGFQREEGTNGYEIFRVHGWDYPSLISTYRKAEKLAREEHIPCIIHVVELTQPQGHSTSGSHERYKSQERLAWEKEKDCVLQMRSWMISTEIATEEELEAMEKAAKKHVRESKIAAWKAFLDPIKQELSELKNWLGQAQEQSSNGAFIAQLTAELNALMDPLRKDIYSIARRALRQMRGEDIPVRQGLSQWITEQMARNGEKYSSHLHSASSKSSLKVSPIDPTYDPDPESVDARVVLRENFDTLLSRYPEALIFGEDSGHIGDVNQGLEGLQEKHGENKVFDTGIREATIVGQGIGMAMRGLRPIAEIQYLDYLLYALQIMSDDLATVQYRTLGGQKAPLIVRTRGHRLEGIWHSGSPMGTVINSLRGINILVPRNMTKAAGFYNTMLESDEPALIVECLNGYRLKEPLPNNLGEFRTAIGKIEIMTEGSDVTLVTYGSNCRIAEEAVRQLAALGISVELIDVQSLIPFDLGHEIEESLEKTNRLVVLDEDVPGGASAFILQKVLEEQDGYLHLDSKPLTITSKEHRPAYGTDGDYFSKPSVEDVVEAIYGMMREVDPIKFPSLY
jgi:pyruvate/2-oxoglutarate/acetoin dehydrogenase E1 component/TPP-dependent pyruvate/acetoin dehydrogenase alpha subunit